MKPDLVNSFLVQYARRHYNFPGVTGQPNLDIPNTLLFGHNFGVLDAIYESRAQVTDIARLGKGKPRREVRRGFQLRQQFRDLARIHSDAHRPPGCELFGGLRQLREYRPRPFRPTPPTVPARSPRLRTFPPTPGPNPFDPLNGTPIVFWGARWERSRILPSGQLPTPPPIPTNWQNAYFPAKR